MTSDSTTADARVVSACELLLDDLDTLTLEIARLIRVDEPYYVDYMSTRQLADAVRPNVIVGLQNVIQNEANQPTVSRRTGRQRAEHGVPLAAVLHAYRIGTRHMWHQLVRRCRPDPEASQALLGSASVLWNSLDLSAQALTTAYQDVETERLFHDSRLREAALAALFSGVTTTGQGPAEVANALRLPKVGRFVVVASDPRSMERDGSAVSVERALSSLGVRSVWRSEADSELGLVALTKTYRADRLNRYLATITTGRAGMSDVFESIVATPHAVTEALMARDAATPGTNVVMRFDEARVAALVAAAPELSTGLARDTLDKLLELPADEQTVLLDTLQAWFDAEGSAAEAGCRLHCHQNTVRYRLNKLAQLTGRDPRRPGDLTRLYLAREAVRLLPDQVRG
ncbi:PucR C-terminal helix-turn-helix domain-containing protein [Prauserella aidingensis]|uniref:PucR family transcriptional regulator n=1 Tax=Prauserella aidingensis TaxID=387890 RepID=UPI0020A575F7|nr:helix-turn-helix domain-containing protein [Prauserella aidingensis]MCP2254516.1 PucR C-terminal helix-turn-helix domain-containing protein [Prauserella aidingensis]